MRVTPLLLTLLVALSGGAAFAESEAAKTYIAVHAKQMADKKTIWTGDAYSQEFLKKHPSEKTVAKLSPQEIKDSEELFTNMFGGTDLKVLKETEVGNTANITLIDAVPTPGMNGPVKKTAQVQMKKEGGVWKIDQEEWTQDVPNVPKSKVK